MNKIYYELEDLAKPLNNLRESGLQRGNEVGFPFEKLGITIKLGHTTYIGAPPASGKTEFWLEILINLSCRYGWKHAIFTPETGEAHNIYAELCSKYARKPYYSTMKGAMSEADRAKAEYFISTHFFVIDPDMTDQTMDFKSFYSQVDLIEQDKGIKIHTTMIDPFNEVENEYLGSNQRDIAVEKMLGDVRRNAKKNKRHNVIITHVRDQQIREKNGVFYYPMATARDFSGGQAWFRKGEQMLIFWRPPAGVDREFGFEGGYADNEVLIRVAKAKPKGSGKTGVYQFFYDVAKNSYFYENHGELIYSERGKQENQLKIKGPEKPTEVDYSSGKTLRALNKVVEESAPALEKASDDPLSDDYVPF